MEYQDITLDVDVRGVATLCLARPQKHNAMSARMLEELTHAAAVLGADAAVRVVVLTAQGASFCAGGDLDWMRAQMAADPDTRAREAAKLAHMLQALNTCPKPIIGALRGNAFGGGVGLACVCDVALGVTGLKMGLTEVRLGLIPATIGPYVVARMGEGAARQVFFSGRIFGAQEAVRLGILAATVAPEEMDAAVEAEIAPYLSAAPGAVAASKALVRSLGPKIDAETIDITIEALKARWESEESAEGIGAFFEKRKAAWMS